MASNNETKTERIAATAIIAAAVLFGFYRLRFGLSYSDEGFSLSSALRYSMGDTPFRDEILSPLRWFDILISPIVSRLPAEGSVLLLRQAAFIVHIACVGALALSIKRYIRPLQSALFFAAALFANMYTYWTPTYHSASFDFICLGASFLISGCVAATTREAAERGVFAGLAFSLAWACELPAAALLAAPAFLAARPSKSRYKSSSDAKEPLRNAASSCGSAALFTSCLMLIFVYLALRSQLLIPDIREDLRIQMSLAQYSSGPLAKLAWLLAEITKAAPWFALHSACWALVVALAPARKLHLIILPLAAVCSIYLAFPLYQISHLYFFSLTYYLEGFCLMVAVAVPAVFILPGRSWPPGGKGAAFSLFLIGAIWNLLLAAFAGAGFFIAVVLSFPFMLASLAICARRSVSRDHPSAPAIRRAVGAAIACFAISAAAANLFCPPAGAWIWQFDSTFKTGKLRGVTFHSEHIDNTNALLEYLTPRLQKGETLLSFYEAPMINYLTDTRQAVRTGLPSRNWPEKERAAFITAMARGGRTPRYAVNLGGVAKEPIYDFVWRNYNLAARFGPFTVWRLKGTPPPGVP